MSLGIFIPFLATLIDLKGLHLNADEKEMLRLWELILSRAKLTGNYNANLTYGVYQIFAELNTFTNDDVTGERIPDYPELNGHLKTLKQKIKEYYNNEIVPTLFEYEFLK